MDRFKAQGPVVLDIRTGLTWTRNASLSEFPLEWNEALAFVDTLNREKRFGFEDWKLPNRRELFSLVSHETVNPSLPFGHPFQHVFTGYYWTSTSCARLPNQAWYIHLGGARVFKGMKKNAYMVWPVRMPENLNPEVLQTDQAHCHALKGDLIPREQTGQDAEGRSEEALKTLRFVEHDHLVNDCRTNRMWVRNANLMRTMLDWPSALAAVELMNKGHQYGFADWRLPSIVELESLVDLGQHTPALPKGHPFYNVQEFYWSSTTSMYDTHYAWALYATDGAIGVGYKQFAEFYCWPVRNMTQDGNGPSAS